MKNSAKILNRIDDLQRYADRFTTNLDSLKIDVQQAIEEWEKEKNSLLPQPVVTPPSPTTAPEPVQSEPTKPEATTPPAVPPPLPASVTTPTPAPDLSVKPAADRTRQQEPQPVAATPAAPKPARRPVPAAPPAPPRKTFWERNPNLEKLVGEKLFPLIGIFVLVTGIGFLVSWAIENEYINTTGRAGIGLLCGGALIGVAHWLRNKYRAFSSILLGGGIATLYFTVTYAHQVYGLFGPQSGSGQTIAFVILALITAFTVISSIFYDRKEVAVIGLIGGFATPFMVMSGDGNYIALFTYILVLNLGMAVLAYFRNWKVLNILSFFFTALIFTVWMLTWTMDDKLPKGGALAFATIFFVVFFIMNIVHNVTKGIKFKAWEYIILILNSFLYFGAALYIVEQYADGIYSGLFTAIVGIFHFAFAFALYKKNKLDKNLVYTLIGMVLTFLTLAAPIQLEGNFITLFWACEAVLLLWLSQRSKLDILKGASVIVNVLMIGSLIMDWILMFEGSLLTEYSFEEYQYTTIPIIANKMFITTLVAVGSLVATNFLLRREEDGAALTILGIPFGKISGYKLIFPFLTVILIYIGGLLEVKYQVKTRTSAPGLSAILISMYHLLIGIGMFAYLSKFKNAVVSVTSIVYSVLLLGGYLVLTHPAIVGLRNSLLAGEVETQGWMFNLHYINTALVFLMMFMLSRRFKAETWLQPVKQFFVWISTAILLFFFCSELDHAMVLGFSDGNYYSTEMWLKSSHKAGYPIVWGITAFALIVAGLRRKHLQMRIVGLSLIGLTIVKVIGIDVWEMTELGRILSFVTLGILILIVAFMYQRLKKLLFDSVEDEATAASEVADNTDRINTEDE